MKAGGSCRSGELDFAEQIYISRFVDKNAVIIALGALAQESRLDIFHRLVEAGPAGLGMSAIGEELGLPHATLSFHLDKLRQAGLITGERDGRTLTYSANYDALVGSIRYLTENCCKDSDMSCSVIIKDKKNCC